jgi:hypothetical protein
MYRFNFLNRENKRSLAIWCCGRWYVGRPAGRVSETACSGTWEAAPLPWVGRRAPRGTQTYTGSEGRQQEDRQSARNEIKGKWMYICVSKQFWTKQVCSGGNAYDLCSGGFWDDFRAGRRLSWLRHSPAVSVHKGECRDSTLKQASTASFHIYIYLSANNNPTTMCYLVWDPESVLK